MRQKPRALAEKEMEFFVSEPGNGWILFVEAGLEQEGIVGALLKSDRDFLLGNIDRGMGIDEIPEQGS